MRILRPIEVTDAVLTYSSVPLPVVAPGADPDPAAYAAGTTYALDALVRSGTRRYRSRQAGNLGKTPATSPDWWLDIGAVNRWGMWDGSLATLTSANDEVVARVTPTGYADSLALFNVDATSVRARVIDSPFDETVSMYYPRPVTNMYEYRFEPFLQRRKLIFTGMPIGPGAVVEVTISKPGGVASCGMCVPALARQWGGTEFGATVGIKDFGEKGFDKWGGPTLLEGAWSDRISASVVIPNALIDGLQRELMLYRSKPVVWLFSDLFEATQVYGVFREFSIVIPNAKKSKCSIEIEGFPI